MSRAIATNSKGVGTPSNTSKAKNAYSDKELQEFKEIILAKLAKEKEHLVFLKDFGNGTDDTSSRGFKTREDAQLAVEKTEKISSIHRSETSINNYENALVRLKN